MSFCCIHVKVREMQRGVIFASLLAIISCSVAVKSSTLWKLPGDFYPTPSTLELSEDGLSLMEPAIVPEPKDGGRWWYAPSRRAHLHSHKSKSRLIRDLLMSNKANEELRLPGDVIPYSYTIHLLPFIEEGNFTTRGQIEIFIDCLKNTNNITMNAADITFVRSTIAVFRIVIHFASERCGKFAFSNDRSSTWLPTVLWQ